MLFLSPQEIADHLMLYRLTPAALMEIRKVHLGDMLALNNTEIGHDIRIMYDLWNPLNPWTSGGFDPEIHDTVDSNPKHPHSITRFVLEIIWKRLR